MSFEWNDILTFRFLNEYKNHSCLWNVHDKNYRSQLKREEAYKQIIKKLQVDGITIKDCLLHLESVQKKYSEEQVKEIESLKSRKVYEPKVIWYTLMKGMLMRVICDENKSLNLKPTASAKSQSRRKQKHRSNALSVCTNIFPGDSNPVKQSKPVKKRRYNTLKPLRGPCIRKFPSLDAVNCYTVCGNSRTDIPEKKYEAEKEFIPSNDVTPLQPKKVLSKVQFEVTDQTLQVCSSSVSKMQPGACGNEFNLRGNSEKMVPCPSYVSQSKCQVKSSCNAVDDLLKRNISNIRIRSEPTKYSEIGRDWNYSRLLNNRTRFVPCPSYSRESEVNRGWQTGKYSVPFRTDLESNICYNKRIYLPVKDECHRNDGMISRYSPVAEDKGSKCVRSAGEHLESHFTKRDCETAYLGTCECKLSGQSPIKIIILECDKEGKEELTYGLSQRETTKTREQSVCTNRTVLCSRETQAWEQECKQSRGTVTDFLNSKKTDAGVSCCRDHETQRSVCDGFSQLQSEVKKCVRVTEEDCESSEKSIRIGQNKNELNLEDASGENTVCTGGTCTQQLGQDNAFTVQLLLECLEQVIRLQEKGAFQECRTASSQKSKEEDCRTKEVSEESCCELTKKKTNCCFEQVPEITCKEKSGCTSTELSKQILDIFKSVLNLQDGKTCGKDLNNGPNDHYQGMNNLRPSVSSSMQTQNFPIEEKVFRSVGTSSNYETLQDGSFAKAQIDTQVSCDLLCINERNKSTKRRAKDEIRKNDRYDDYMKNSNDRVCIRWHDKDRYMKTLEGKQKRVKERDRVCAKHCLGRTEFGRDLTKVQLEDLDVCSRYVLDESALDYLKEVIKEKQKRRRHSDSISEYWYHHQKHYDSYNENNHVSRNALECNKFIRINNRHHQCRKCRCLNN